MLVKGGDYARNQVVGRDVVEAQGGEVILVDLVQGFSTTRIVEKSRAQKSPTRKPRKRARALARAQPLARREAGERVVGSAEDVYRGAP